MSDNPSNLIPETVAKIAEKAFDQAPVYKDLVQPAAQTAGDELAETTRTVLGFVNTVLTPVWALNQFNTKLREWVAVALAPKVARIPPERRQPPLLHVVGPALEGMKYAQDDDNLKQLYAQLIASSMDKDCADKVHPSFAEIIKQMSPMEAVMMRHFVSRTGYPLVSVYARSRETLFFTPKVYDFTALIDTVFGGDDRSYKVSSSNLRRLGLLDIPNYNMMQRYLTGTQEERNALDSHPIVVAALKSCESDEAQIWRGGIGLTPLGRQFIEVCVLRKDELA